MPKSIRAVIAAVVTAVIVGVMAVATAAFHGAGHSAGSSVAGVDAVYSPLTERTPSVSVAVDRLTDRTAGRWEKPLLAVLPVATALALLAERGAVGRVRDVRLRRRALRRFDAARAPPAPSFA